MVMSADFLLRKKLSNNFFYLEKKIKAANSIKDKRKRLSELLKIKNDVKSLLKQYDENKFDDNFLFRKFTKNIKAFIFKLEKEYAKK